MGGGVEREHCVCEDTAGREARASCTGGAGGACAVAGGGARGCVVVAWQRGGRALLNLGHTFAHAIETLHHLSPTDNPGDAPLLHGEAVGLGLVACATTAVRMGLAPAALPEQISTLLTRCWLPASVRGLPDGAQLLALMGADKKTTGGKLRLVLPCKTHHARAVEILDHAPVLAGWDAIRME